MPMHANSRRYAAQAARYARHSPTASHNLTSREACTSALPQAKPSALAFCNKDMIRSTSDIPKGLHRKALPMPNFARRFSVFLYGFVNHPDPTRLYL